MSDAGLPPSAPRTHAHTEGALDILCEGQTEVQCLLTINAGLRAELASREGGSPPDDLVFTAPADLSEAERKAWSEGYNAGFQGGLYEAAGRERAAALPPPEEEKKMSERTKGYFIAGESVTDGVGEEFGNLIAERDRLVDGLRSAGALLDALEPLSDFFLSEPAQVARRQLRELVRAAAHQQEERTPRGTAVQWDHGVRTEEPADECAAHRPERTMSDTKTMHQQVGRLLHDAEHADSGLFMAQRMGDLPAAERLCKEA